MQNAPDYFLWPEYLNIQSAHASLNLVSGVSRRSPIIAGAAEEAHPPSGGLHGNDTVASVYKHSGKPHKRPQVLDVGGSF